MVTMDTPITSLPRHPKAGWHSPTPAIPPAALFRDLLRIRGGFCNDGRNSREDSSLEAGLLPGSS